MLSHVPVLLKEVLQSLRAGACKLFLDCTFGGGGHTRAMLELGEDVRVVSIDCDPEAIERSKPIKEEFGDRFKLYDLNFRDLDQIAEDAFDGVLFDFGLSSFQLGQRERGFSFREEGVVDMRLNPREGISAKRFLETASEEDLVHAVRNFGEELKWRRVVQAILDERGTGKLSSTLQLADVIKTAVGGGKFSRIHPATKTFQGIRIAVNEELSSIERALPFAFDKLKDGGLLAAISFHSLEDRIVKRFFNRMAGRPEHRLDRTVQGDREKMGSLVTRKPIVPGEDEIKENPRSRSAKLRILRKELLV